MCQFVSFAHFPSPLLCDVTRAFNKQWLLAGEFSDLPKVAKNGEFRASTRQNGRFPKYARLTRLADIPQAVLCGLARLVKGEFGKFYANLASLANLASVG
jgi:hypothetical protein